MPLEPSEALGLTLLLGFSEIVASFSPSYRVPRLAWNLMEEVVSEGRENDCLLDEGDDTEETA